MSNFLLSTRRGLLATTLVAIVATLLVIESAHTRRAEVESGRAEETQHETVVGLNGFYRSLAASTFWSYPHVTLTPVL